MNVQTDNYIDLMCRKNAEIDAARSAVSRRAKYRDAKLAYYKNRARELDNFVNAVIIFLDADDTDTKKVDNILDYVIAHYEGEARPRF